MIHAESNLYWSNCLIEAIRAKIRNPKIKILLVPSAHGMRVIPHFMWSRGKYVYDFGWPLNKKDKMGSIFFFRGQIRRHEYYVIRRYMGKIKG